MFQHPQNNLINKKEGFTLLEMTVALGIFVVLFTLTLGIYSYSLKAEQRTIQMSRLQKEAQLIMEVMAKKIRSSKIDYDFYTGSDINPSGETVLALLDKRGESTVFRLQSQSIQVCTTGCGSQASPNDTSFYAVPAQDILINDLIFLISPLSDPFSLDEPPTEFPKVTVVLDLENTFVGQTRNLVVQQTVPQRLGGL